MIVNNLKSYCYIPLSLIQDKSLTPNFRFGCILLLTYVDFDTEDIEDIFIAHGALPELANSCLEYLIKNKYLMHGK